MKKKKAKIISMTSTPPVVFATDSDVSYETAGGTPSEKGSRAPDENEGVGRECEFLDIHAKLDSLDRKIEFLLKYLEL